MRSNEDGADPIPPLQQSTGLRPADSGKVVVMRTGFLELCDAHHHRIVAFLMNYGATLADAQDATQDAFLEAWQTLLRPGAWEAVENPPAWLCTVALRRYQRPLGPRTRIPTTPGPAEDLPEIMSPGPEPAELTAQTLDVIAALRRLDPDTRAVMAFHLDGFSAVDIAYELGLEGQRVRNLLKKARTHLARTLARTRLQEGGTAR